MKKGFQNEARALKMVREIIKKPGHETEKRPGGKNFKTFPVNRAAVQNQPRRSAGHKRNKGDMREPEPEAACQPEQKQVMRLPAFIKKPVKRKKDQDAEQNGLGMKPHGHKRKLDKRRRGQNKKKP